MKTIPTKTDALKFIIILGIVSLFADISYEGARSIFGPYLGLLGANGAIIGLLVGSGELIGYGARFLSGYLSDRTQKYWAITIFGYLLTLTAVPLLALAKTWEMALILIFLERLGKAIRNPPRDAMISYATHQIGRGWGFGLHQSLDQIGAILGPLMMAAVLIIKGSYNLGFILFIIPGVFALTALLIARFVYPRPQEMEKPSLPIEGKGLGSLFWLYVLAIGLVAAGYADFAILSYHFQKTGLISINFVPIFYSIAMAVEGLSALVLGRLFDRRGIVVLFWTLGIAPLFAPLCFMGNATAALIGIILWGIGLGVQQSAMRAIVATLAPVKKRGSAYGSFNLGYGVFWFTGSILIGILYDHSPIYAMLFSLCAQFASLPVLFLVRQRMRSKRS